jgi:hypothetical protein
LEKLELSGQKAHKGRRVFRVKLGQPGPSVRLEKLGHKEFRASRVTPEIPELYPLPLQLLTTQKLERFPLLLLP